jgi:starch synthase
VQEGLGLVNAEALAHGTAVVSTNVGGIPEVLDYGNCGYVVRASDPLELSKAIQECVHASATTAERIQNGRAFILDRFDQGKMFSELNKILQEVEVRNTASG